MSKYEIISMNGTVMRFAENVDGIMRCIEEVKDFSERFFISWQLPFAISAEVTRCSGQLESIIVRTSNDEVEVARKTVDQGGPFGAQCQPIGDRVPVKVLIIDFRPIDDELTDRGTLWVSPRENRAFFIIDIKAVQQEGAVAEIVAEAESVLQQKLLSLFETDI